MYAPQTITKAADRMSSQLILYIGSPAKGQAFSSLVEAEGGFVYLPDNLMQALGMYITYLPQVVIIDMSLDYAQEAYEHLRSVDAAPLVLLTNQRVRELLVYSLPPHISAEALVDALERIHPAAQRVPNGLYHYA